MQQPSVRAPHARLLRDPPALASNSLARSARAARVAAFIVKAMGCGLFVTTTTRIHSSASSPWTLHGCIFKLQYTCSARLVSLGSGVSVSVVCLRFMWNETRAVVECNKGKMLRGACLICALI